MSRIKLAVLAGIVLIVASAIVLHFVANGYLGGGAGGIAADSIVIDRWEPAYDENGNPNFAPQVVLLPLDPITDFPIQSAEEASQSVPAADLVIGVTVNGQSRAYPINMLCGPDREVFNDTLGGVPIAVTW